MVAPELKPLTIRSPRRAAAPCLAWRPVDKRDERVECRVASVCRIDLEICDGRVADCPRHRLGGGRKHNAVCMLAVLAVCAKAALAAAAAALFLLVFLFLLLLAALLLPFLLFFLLVLLLLLAATIGRHVDVPVD
jgi:hypothetical protein